MTGLFIVIVSVGVPDSLLAPIDALVSSHGFANRSEVIREALRDFISKFTAETQSNRLVSSINILRDGHYKNVGILLNQIISKHDDIIQGNFHLHVTEAYCFDVLICRGEKLRIFQIIKELREMEGVSVVDYIALPELPVHETHVSSENIRKS